MERSSKGRNLSVVGRHRIVEESVWPVIWALAVALGGFGGGLYWFWRFMHSGPH